MVNISGSNQRQLIKDLDFHDSFLGMIVGHLIYQR